MKLYVHIELDSGGRVNLSGDDLSHEDVNEVFAMLTSGTVMSSVLTEERLDIPLPGVCMIPACGCDGTPHP